MKLFEQVSTLRLCNLSKVMIERVFFNWNEMLYFKFDCERGNGMGPQGLGMVPWESPSGILSPTVP